MLPLMLQFVCIQYSCMSLSWYCEHVVCIHVLSWYCENVVCIHDFSLYCEHVVCIHVLSWYCEHVVCILCTSHSFWAMLYIYRILIMILWACCKCIHILTWYFWACCMHSCSFMILWACCMHSCNFMIFEHVVCIHDNFMILWACYMHSYISYCEHVCIHMILWACCMHSCSFMILWACCMHSYNFIFWAKNWACYPSLSCPQPWHTSKVSPYLADLFFPFEFSPISSTPFGSSVVSHIFTFHTIVSRRLFCVHTIVFIFLRVFLLE